jgi:hypothetical protein
MAFPIGNTNDCLEWRMIMLTKIALAVALAITALAAVPVSAHPNHCQEDLGYGRTGSFGCGG